MTGKSQHIYHLLRNRNVIFTVEDPVEYVLCSPAETLSNILTRHTTQQKITTSDILDLKWLMVMHDLSGHEKMIIEELLSIYTKAEHE
jgi:hypothetical protein